MRYLSIDRFEGSLAICEGDEKRMFGIEKSEMPADAKEGDVIRIDDEGVISVDENETRRRRSAVLELQKKMSRK